MIGAVPWPLGADERIGVLLTILADNVSDVVDNAADVDALVERLRLHLMLECLDRNRSH
ncbi:hypothetical protein WDM22_38665 [Bradyrhizobium septentrionale]|uniref:hypothetical protein n=1 Tax=Bradyrhizobium septentrionale TaxID=1404411 RepID=UPI0030D51E9E